MKHHRSRLVLLCLLLVCLASGKGLNRRRLPTVPRTFERQSKNKQQVATPEGGDASMASSVFNLVNNVAGAGLLTLSAGMANGTGWIPAIAICSLLGLISAHTFVLIGDACELTGETDFKGLWGRTIGEDTTYMVDSIIAIMCLACSVIYSGILGDVFTPLLKQAGVPNAWNGRTSNILIITVALLLPLSLIKNLSSLAFTSILGFASILYTVIFIVFRALDGSYKIDTGRFVNDKLVALPSFDKATKWGMDFTSLVLMSNLGLAYVAHYNGPSFYRELENTNSKRFRKMVGISFTLLVSLYVVTMVAGYSTFGDACQGNILLNYHPHDVLSTLGRFATGFSILFGFPLVTAGARAGIIGAAAGLGFPKVGAASNHFALVASILAFVTFVAITVQDVSLVVGLTGAAMGSFIVYICPVVIYAKAVKMVQGPQSAEYASARKNLVFVPLGCFLASLGVYMTLKSSSG